jgi:hypothetical protein
VHAVARVVKDVGSVKVIVIFLKIVVSILASVLVLKVT